MQQNQCVQTSSFELAFQLQDLIFRETKTKSPSQLYNFSTSTKAISYSKQIKQINSHRSIGEINTNIQSPAPQKLLGKGVEGKAMLTNLMFPSQNISKRKGLTNVKNIHMARRLSQYNMNESKSGRQFEWINKFNLQLQKCNYYVNNEKSVKLKPQRKRQLSVIDDVRPISSQNLLQMELRVNFQVEPGHQIKMIKLNMNTKITLRNSKQNSFLSSFKTTHRHTLSQGMELKFESPTNRETSGFTSFNP